MHAHRSNRTFASCRHLVTTAILGVSALAAQAEPAPPPFAETSVHPVVVPALRTPAAPASIRPRAEAEPAASVTGPSPFGSNVRALPNAAGQTLTAPVTVNANTSTDALTVTQNGGGRAVTGSVTNGSNGLSAVKGITNGTGSGVNGVNSGTTGPAGKFQVTASGSAQPGLVSTTAGTGNALQAIVTSTTVGSETAAVLGQHTGASDSGIGVEGDGNFIGVRGDGGSGYGIYGHSTGGFAVYGFAEGSGLGVGGSANTSAGVYGSSNTNAGVYGSGYTGNGVTGVTSTASGNAAYGVYGQGDSTYGVVGSSANGTGMSARSTNGYALTATSTNGIGVYGYTGAPTSSYAGYFVGPLRTTSTMTAQSYASTSDRNEKQAIEAIDGAAVLDKVAALPISAWDYRDKPGIRHIGPMAQDFRAAFGLGADDKHIDLVDAAGVSLAAIQALQRQLQDKDARITALEARAARAEVAEAAVDALATRLAALERTATVAASLPSAAP